ncbi:hypothetical protein J6590_030848 [Homalodisca vitripennis]|nr:hypothetical protein J6590_030848 [Homalodisca vitripennis]
MNSEGIRDQLNMSFYDNESSSDSVPSLFQNLNDSDDPSVHLTDIEYESDDGRMEQPNLNQMEIDLPENEKSLVNRIINNSDEVDDEILVSKEGDVVIWHKVKGYLNNFEFSPRQPPGVTDAAKAKLRDNSPFEFYSLFIDDEVLDMIVNETNRYAEQCLIMSILKGNNSYTPYINVTNPVWVGYKLQPKRKHFKLEQCVLVVQSRTFNRLVIASTTNRSKAATQRPRLLMYTTFTRVFHHPPGSSFLSVFLSQKHVSCISTSVPVCTVQC